MATIVFVHGIAQQQYGADVLENLWLPALASGVRAAGFDALADRLWRDRASPEGIEARVLAGFRHGNCLAYRLHA